MYIKNWLVIIGLSCFSACKVNPDLEQEKKAIMILHDQQRQAHFEKNTDLLLKGGAPGFVEVNRGFIKSPTKEESKQKFNAYFNTVDFIKWDDMTPPIFNFSDDATMATTVVDKLVIVKNKEENNRADTVRFAWLAVYKKMGGEWKLAQVASTNR